MGGRGRHTRTLQTHHKTKIKTKTFPLCFFNVNLVFFPFIKTKLGFHLLLQPFLPFFFFLQHEEEARYSFPCGNFSLSRCFCFLFSCRKFCSLLFCILFIVSCLCFFFLCHWVCCFLFSLCKLMFLDNMGDGFLLVLECLLVML